MLERIGAVAYRLRLPPKARIHDVFHFALLKKLVGEPPSTLVPLPLLLHGQVVATPAAVARARLNCVRWLFIGKAAHMLMLLGMLSKISRIAILHFSLRTSCLMGSGEVLWTRLWAASIGVDPKPTAQAMARLG